MAAAPKGKHNGELEVDKSVVYHMEPGVDPNVQHPESILKV
jgi:hypothetical protein